LSKSVESRLPLAVGTPTVPLLKPPASVTLPVVVPVMMALSFTACTVRLTIAASLSVQPSFAT